MSSRRVGEVTDLDQYEDLRIDDLIGARRATPLAEMGATGLRRSAGVIDEEFLPALRGRKAVKVYREMRENDTMVGALLFTIEELLRQAEWNVVGATQDEEGQAAAEFVESCMEDMSHSWGDMISEILTMLTYGWSWFEVTYKQRVGPWEKDPRKRSKHKDGHIGWRKISIRGQETLHRWIFDKSGGVQAMVQMAPPHYKQVVLPIEKCLLFKFRENKGSPEGMSMLRTAYRPWFIKKRLEEFEAIGVERDLAGIPMVRVPETLFSAKRSSQEYKTLQAFKKLATSVRRDEHEGIVFPMKYDRETKQPLYNFELLSSSGSRQFDTNSIIQRYEQRILMTVLADFIMVGHQGQGSYAMHVDKTGIFRAALNSIAKSIAEVFNRYAIPRLFEINGWFPDELPQIVPSNVDAPNLSELASAMTSMASMGMEWFPNPDLEKFVRKIMGLPELPEDVLEQRQEMAEQHQAVAYAQSMMEMLGAKQKAEMTAQGMSPEQAQQEAETPTPEQQEGQMAQQAVQQEEAGAKEEMKDHAAERQIAVEDAKARTAAVAQGVDPNSIAPPPQEQPQAAPQEQPQAAPQEQPQAAPQEAGEEQLPVDPRVQAAREQRAQMEAALAQERAASRAPVEATEPEEGVPTPEEAPQVATTDPEQPEGLSRERIREMILEEASQPRLPKRKVEKPKLSRKKIREMIEEELS